MSKGVIAVLVSAPVLTVALGAGLELVERNGATVTAIPTHTMPPTSEVHEAHVYARVTLDDGTVYEGRIRFGGDEEVLWSHFFNGRKAENPWATRVPHDRLPTERGLLGDRVVDLSRPFLVRLGQLVRIDAPGRDFRVTLKSGRVVELARFEADDLADGLRVWDEARGVVDLGEWDIRSIEFMSAPGSGEAPAALYGTVRSRAGDFTGLVQWDREQALASDELVGEGADGAVRLRFERIRSIARGSAESARVTLDDGREVVLSESREVGRGHRGIYVDDARYGRVLVSWEVFERLDLREGGDPPAYDDFAAGSLLSGTVVTRTGERVTGRLVYDLDESETTETLDAPWDGVDYLIPFGRIASIAVPAAEGEPVRVTLKSGEELRLERAGDLGASNAGMLVMPDGGEPEYVPWAEVARVELGG